MNILVTGGAGYIGSHTTVELMQAGHTVIIVDNLSNSSEESVNRIAEITGTRPLLYRLDVQDREGLSAIFKDNTPDCVIHFAGLKAVGESVEQPLTYYRNNIDSTLTLLDVMQQHEVRSLIFSSSATVYGSAPVPYSESSSTGQGITNPYGWTKFMIEQIIRDHAAATPGAQYTLLRYFNPVGAHESGRIGEDPSGIPNNLVPYIAQVAVGKREQLSVFGNDYPTPDGTCRRDYIHVVDLARGHVAALSHLRPGVSTYNLGTGTPTSVLDMIHAFERACGHTIPYVIAPRRTGDLPEFYADARLAKTELNWHATKTIDDMCADTWRWQSQNPNGYKI
ncbi:MAG: UDP-glucose 4-epimerase GalE [Candidatus Saccharimonadales bacterium]